MPRQNGRSGQHEKPLSHCEQLKEQGGQGEGGLWGAAGKGFKGKKKKFQRKKQSHSPLTAAKTLVCFILSKQNSFCRARSEDLGCSGRFTRLGETAPAALAGLAPSVGQDPQPKGLPCPLGTGWREPGTQELATPFYCPGADGHRAVPGGSRATSPALLPGSSRGPVPAGHWPSVLCQIP